MEKKTRILVGGVFDIIHLGHIKFLWAAKSLAKNSELIVIIARDSTVKKLKGREPIFSEQERLEIVNNLKPVDRVYLGHELKERKTIYDIVLELKPDIIALGYDQNFDENDLRNWAIKKGLNLKVVRLGKFSFNGINSSSEVRKRILGLIKR